MTDSPALSSPDFLSHWEKEGRVCHANGDYAWMAERLPVETKKVLEIGCGAGYSTLALLEKGLAVLALDQREDCLVRASEITGRPAALSLLCADLRELSDAARKTLLAFQPDVIVCWLMGAPPEEVGIAADTPRDKTGEFVAAYREKLHRAAAELAGALPSVRFAHLVDRTAIPWQGKDHGRDLLTQYHLRQTFSGLPFTASRRDALYRRLDAGAELTELRRAHPALKSVTPALASLLLRRAET